MGFSYLEQRDKCTITEVSFQIKAGCEAAHYAQQPFIDLGHGISPNTGPLGFTVRIDTADQASGSLIAFKPHCTFHALPKQKVFISGVATDPDSSVQMPKNKSVVYFDLADNIAKSEHVSLFISEGLSSQVSDFILTKLSDIPNFTTKVFTQL